MKSKVYKIVLVFAFSIYLIYLNVTIISLKQNVVNYKDENDILVSELKQYKLQALQSESISNKVEGVLIDTVLKYEFKSSVVYFKYHYLGCKVCNSNILQQLKKLNTNELSDLVILGTFYNQNEKEFLKGELGDKLEVLEIDSCIVNNNLKKIKVPMFFKVRNNYLSNVFVPNKYDLESLNHYLHRNL